MNFIKASSEFSSHCAVERGLSVHTLQAYDLDLKDFYKWLPRDCTLDAIDTERLKDYLTDMVAVRKLSPATLKRRLASLRSFFRYLDERGLVQNPFTGWRLRLPKSKRLPRALSRHETVALMHMVAELGGAGRTCDPDLWTALNLIIATGLRVGELCRIRVSDLSPDGGALRIQGKGSRDRIAYIADPTLKRSLQRLLRRRQNEVGFEASLLVNKKGLALRPQSVRSKLRSSARAAGISRRVTPHMLRHTAATLLIESGVDIRFIQKLLGHSSIATTEIYTHVADEALRVSLERANVLSGLLAQQ